MPNDTTYDDELLLHGHVVMTNEQYHAAPGESKSKLDAMAISPLAYWDAHENPDREPREEKDCFMFGSGTHTLVLEPHLFEQEFAVGFDSSAYPDALDTVADLKKELASRNLMVSGTKPELVDRLIDSGFPSNRIMLSMRREHDARTAGRTQISATDYKDMLGMLKSINGHHTAAGLIDGAYIEQSYFAKDPDTGILLKCRPDIITRNRQIVPDLKTTDDVSTEGFSNTIYRRNYHMQAAICLDILAYLYGDDAPKIFAFIAVQKKRPYDVNVVYLNDQQVEDGRRLYKRLLQQLVDCRCSGIWLGVDGGQPNEAITPRWAQYLNEAA